MILFCVVLILAHINQSNATASNVAKIKVDVCAALNQGTKWRTSKDGTAKIFKSTENIYAKYNQWIWKYRGQRMPKKIALVMHIESRGNAFSKTHDVNLGELGLLSVKRLVAKKYDINPCHPELNIWAAQKLYHERKKDVEEMWPWFQNADQEQQMLVLDAMGSAGYGAVIYLVQKSAKGKQARQHPYNAICSYIKTKGNTLKNVDKWGKQPAQQMAFRVGLVKSMHQHSLNWQNNKLLIDDNSEWNFEKPTEDYPFVPAPKYYNCKKNWPELEFHTP